MVSLILAADKPGELPEDPLAFWYFVTVMLFILLVLFAELYFIYKSAEQSHIGGKYVEDNYWGHYNIVRFVGLTLIVGAVLVIVSIDRRATDRAAIFGLLGTLAGYFLHPSTSKKMRRNANENGSRGSG